MILHPIVMVLLCPPPNPSHLPSAMIENAIDCPRTGKLDNKLISWQEDLVQQ